MADRRFTRDAGRLAQRAYTLRPARSLGLRMAVWVVVGMLCACAGAAGFALWQAKRAGVPLAPCGALSVDEPARQAELTRARLALSEQSAARAAVQKTADGAMAEVARLNAELQFLRSQSKGRPTAQSEAAGR